MRYKKVPISLPELLTSVCTACLLCARSWAKVLSDKFLHLILNMPFEVGDIFFFLIEKDTQAREVKLLAQGQRATKEWTWNWNQMSTQT